LAKKCSIGENNNTYLIDRKVVTLLSFLLGDPNNMASSHIKFDGSFSIIKSYCRSVVIWSSIGDIFQIKCLDRVGGLGGLIVQILGDFFPGLTAIKTKGSTIAFIFPLMM